MSSILSHINSWTSQNPAGNFSDDKIDDEGFPVEAFISLFRIHCCKSYTGKNALTCIL